ncbi:chromate transporter [Guggenheimella bovis]
MNDLFKLFTSFFKIGMLTFGGGYTMLPLLERECVDKNQWVTNEELLDYYAIGQVIPGIIAVNTANFIGHKAMGKKGSLVSVLGMVAPSIVIITLVYYFFTPLMTSPIVARGMVGIRIAVSALVLDALLKMAKKGVKDIFTLILFFVSASLILFSSINPALLVLVGGLVSIVIGRVK